MIFDYMGIMLDKQAMAEYDFTIGVTLTDIKEQYMLRIKNGVVLVYENADVSGADVNIKCPKNAMLLVLQNNSENFAKMSEVTGDAEKLNLFMSNMNQLSSDECKTFNIVEP